MDIPTVTGNYLTVRELKMLRNAGIETGMYFSLHWDKYEVAPGQFNPDYFLDILDRYENARMKVILPLWTTQSSKLPENWYCRGPGNIMPRHGFDKEYIISPFSVDGQAYANTILRKVKAEFGGEKVMVIATGMRDGESIMPPEPLYYGIDALDDWHKEHRGMPDHQTRETLEWLRAGYTRMLIDRQRVLGNELWFCWHFRKAALSPCYGVQWASDYMAEYHQLSFRHNINHISYSHFPFEDMPAKIDEFRRTWGSNEWVGSEYCEGLRDGNAIKAHDAGLRGLILAPCHPYTGHGIIEKWQLVEIEKAIRLWG
jgi:hypothetical protein